MLMHARRLVGRSAMVAVLAIMATVTPVLAGVASATGAQNVAPQVAPTPPQITPDLPCTLTWTGALSNNWTDSASVSGFTVTNWLPVDINGNGRLPSASDVACLPAGNYTVLKSSGNVNFNQL